MDMDAVIGLLGRDYRSMARGRMDYWLYSSSRYDIEIVFCSGSLDSAKFKKKNADGSITLLMQIEEDELAETGLPDVVIEAGRVVNGRFVPDGAGDHNDESP